MYPIAVIGIAATASAAGSIVDEGRPVNRTIAGSRGDLRRREGQVRSIIPDNIAIVENNFSCKRTDIVFAQSGVLGIEGVQIVRRDFKDRPRRADYSAEPLWQVNC
jgi:hypothetical protein